MKNIYFTKKEKRDCPLSIRLPLSAIEKLREISHEYDRSQSEVVEILINQYWKEMTSLKKAEVNQYEISQ